MSGAEDDFFTVVKFDSSTSVTFSVFFFKIVPPNRPEMKNTLIKATESQVSDSHPNFRKKIEQLGGFCFLTMAMGHPVKRYIKSKQEKNPCFNTLFIINNSSAILCLFEVLLTSQPIGVM